VDERPGSGPRVTVIAAAGQHPRAPRVLGTSVSIAVDGAVAGADVYAGINVLAPGFEIPMHWHRTGELQFILSGTGVALDAMGAEILVSANSTIFSPAGSDGAHGFINTGDVPLTILFVYPSPGGDAPDLNFVDQIDQRDR
jgi:uncharacterized cupin superfamily protein